MKILEQIPVDLIVQILSRLPVKSIARLRCESKDWNSFLHNSDFTNLFLKVSSSRPRLIFAVLKKGKWLFFSAHHPLNPEKNLYPVNGLLCTGFISFKRVCNGSKMIIYKSIPLPIIRGRMDEAKTFLGYDPINKQYKLLCLSKRKPLVIEHQVLTLGIKKPAWRMIECSLPLQFPYSPICMNGVLYYLAYHGSRKILVCFDVRSEKFKIVETGDNVKSSLWLINYKGKVDVFTHAAKLNRKTKILECLVLDDVEKTEWWQHIYVLPPLWKDLVAHTTLKFVGMSGNGELVFSSSYWYDHLYIIFYNVEKNTIAEVRIH